MRAGVDAPALDARIDERADPDVADDAWFARGNIAQKMGHHPLRQDVGLELSRDGHLAQARRPPPMGGVDAANHPLMREAIRAAAAAIAHATDQIER